MAAKSGRMGSLRKLAVLAGTSLVVVPSCTQSALAQPSAPRLLPASVNQDPNRRVIAFIHGNVPIYREELGNYLITRGGMDKIELLVNRRIIEVAMTCMGITVTPEEIEAGLAADFNGAKVEPEAFIQYIRERYGKSLFEWKQDVIRPRLQLGKLCQSGIVIAPEELQRAFESQYGEKREAQIIVWPKAAPALPDQEKAKARTGATEFDRLASIQPDNGLAQARGMVNPVGRHIDGEDPNVEKALFTMKEGEISPWIETKTTWTCVRLVKIIPPDPKLTFEKVRGEVEKDVFDRKVSAAIPEMFARIKKEADPKLTRQVPLPAKFDPAQPPVRIDHPDPNVLAIVYGNIAITREDLGDFIIVRGGFDKIELLVNKRIIEWEAARRGITATPEEIEAAKNEYVKKLGIANATVADFIKYVLPKRNLTEASWIEDIIAPELIMSKMCRDRVKVSEEDLQKAFETKYGEKRAAKIILWRKEDFRIATKQWEEARKGEVEFDRIARMQFNPELASAAGKVAPIGRYPQADNPRIAEVVFALREGELSQLFETPAGIMCVKCLGVVPAVPGATLEQYRAAIHKEVFDQKLSNELGVMFGEMKQAANPNILLRGQPTAKEYDEGMKQVIQGTFGGIQK